MDKFHVIVSLNAHERSFYSSYMVINLICVKSFNCTRLEFQNKYIRLNSFQRMLNMEEVVFLVETYIRRYGQIVRI